MLEFAQLQCETLGPDRGPLRLRLAGRTRNGRRLMLDFAAVPAALAIPAQLTHAVVRVGDAAGGGAWQVGSDQGRFELGAARAFVHEDVSAIAATAVPPRTVPWQKRLFWRLVFALLATRAGRRWLQRRATRG
jgi:hypothetical protein